MERVVLWCFLCFAGIVAQNPPADCASGLYGANCELKCSENCKSVTCDRNNGHCTGGCKPGWKPSDPTCKLPCDNGWYGEGCTQQCSVQCATLPCNKVNGACTSCKPGYQSSLCDTPCDDGKYGQNCQFECGKCKGDNTVCDKVMGQCANGCLPGYTGNNCHDKCKAGFYGEGCQSMCGNCKPAGSRCDHTSGVCPNRCVAGFKSALCKEECAAGEWGENCQSTCSQNCQDPTACDKKTGRCACVAGYQRTLCTEKCQVGRFGQDCLGKCGECRDGHSDCHHVTGNCTRCKDNWELPLCERCIPGKFGITCSLDCGACGGEGRCRRDTGLCLSAFCQPGWMSSKCEQKCPPGWYGDNCTHQCGACGNGSRCRHDNGVCQQDCEEGFEGVMCQRRKPSLVGPVVGAVVAAAFLIAVAIVFSVWLVKCRGSRFKPMPMAQSKEDFPTMAEMTAVDPEDIPPTPGTSEVYQNMQVNHVGADAAEVNPAANYDRVDMAKRAEEAHHYEVHTALQREAGGLLNRQQDDPLYQNTNDVMASPPANQHQMAAPAEPEATYGNL